MWVFFRVLLKQIVTWFFLLCGTVLGDPVKDAEREGDRVIQTVAETVFSSCRGYYDAPFNLVISCATPGAKIIYTEDGSFPSIQHGLSGSESEPMTLLISGTTVVRAVAVREGLASSDVETHTYLFREDVVRQRWGEGRSEVLDVELDQRLVNDPLVLGKIMKSFLRCPTVSVVTPYGEMFGSEGIYSNPKESGEDWERPCSFEWISDFKKGKQVNCGVRIQGASSREVSPKHSFRLSFKSKFGAKKFVAKVFPGSPVAEFDSLVLRNPTQDSWTVDQSLWRADARYVNDMWAAETQREMGHLAPRHRWVHLFLNGLYWGIYDLCERPDEHFAAAHLGGGEDDYDVFNTGRLRHGTRENWSRAHALVRSKEMAGRAVYEEAEKLVDLECLVDYFLLNIYMGNIDWPQKNYWLVGGRGAEPRFRFVSWDAEIGFFKQWEHPRNRDQLSALDFDPLSGHNAFLMASHGAGYYFIRLKKNKEFRVNLADRIYHHMRKGGALSSSEAAMRYRALIREVEPLLFLESARWGDLYSEEVLGPHTKKWIEHTGEDSWLFEEFFPNRSERLKGHFRRAGLYPLVDAPLIEQQSDGKILVKNPNDGGEIYYTSDGEDPRERWGGKALGIRSREDVVIGHQNQLLVRVLKEGEWSPLVVRKREGASE
ncbi:MAG: CotH kinase family protein [Verrucomicrobiaceae bacterium]